MRNYKRFVSGFVELILGVSLLISSGFISKVINPPADFVLSVCALGVMGHGLLTMIYQE